MRPPELEESVVGTPSTAASENTPAPPVDLPFDDGSKNNLIPESESESESESEFEIPAVVNINEEEEPLFSPPLYIQRYCAVERVIEALAEETPLESLLDLGCAELKFLVRAKNGKIFQRIVGLDLDEVLISSHSRRIQPGVFEIINKRDRPLTIEVYAGDATQPDERLLNVDVVTAVELIEHMEKETHVQLAVTLFHVIQPKLAVFTTPNVEYNPLFPGGSLEQRRHWDHRFEWTRAEFRNWALGVTETYPAYSVQFEGVGFGPPDTLNTHGCCSQMAVFTRNCEITKTKKQTVPQPHKLLEVVEFPWALPKTLSEEICTVMDGECYALAKELQEDEEGRGYFHRAWFQFTVEEVYKTRWRLQELLPLPTNPLQKIREALRLLSKDWLRFDEEKDEVSYQLIEEDEEEEEDPSLDVEGEGAGAGLFPVNSEMGQVLEELQDPVESGW